MATPTTAANHNYAENNLACAAMLLGVTPEYLASRLTNNDDNLSSAIMNNTLSPYQNNNNNTFPPPAVVQQRPSRQQSLSPNSTPSGPSQGQYDRQDALDNSPSVCGTAHPTNIGTNNGLDFDEKDVAGYDLSISINPSELYTQSGNSSSNALLNAYRPSTNKSSSPPRGRFGILAAAPSSRQPSSRSPSRQVFRTPTPPTIYSTTSHHGKALPPPPYTSGELIPVFVTADSDNAVHVHAKDHLSLVTNNDTDEDGGVHVSSALVPEQEPSAFQPHNGSSRSSQPYPFDTSLYVAKQDSACTRPSPEIPAGVDARHKRQKTNNDTIPDRDTASSLSPGGDSATSTKSCLRCRFQHLKCEPDPANPEGACLNCRRLRRPTLANLPCYWLMMTDAFLYRDQHAPNPLHTNRWRTLQVVNIEQWQDNELKDVQVGHVGMQKPYPLTVRRFVPLEDGEAEEKWVSGKLERRQKLAPYAIADMSQAVKMFRKYITESVAPYIKAFVKTEDPLYLNTYRMAYRLAYHNDYKGKIPDDERQLLREVFSLWVCCRKTSNPERFFGSESLGERVVDDPNSPWFNTAPIPPLMIAQMQCIFYSSFLPNWQKSVLEKLWSICKKTQRKNWLTIYLTEFILLHSASMLTRRNAEYARSLGQKTRYFNPFAIRQLQEGCNNLLAHFHYFNKGNLPFQQALHNAGMKEIIEEAGLDSHQAEFIQETANCVRRNESAWHEIRKGLEFENDAFWISQLYIKGWRRSPTA